MQTDRVISKLFPIFSPQERVYGWTRTALVYLSMPAIVIGFAAMFWHFAWWLGILFALATYAAYRIFDYLCL